MEDKDSQHQFQSQILEHFVKKSLEERNQSTSG